MPKIAETKGNAFMSDDQNKMAKPVSLFEAMIKESEAYTSSEIIESVVESGQNLSKFPLQPLYLALRALPVDRITELLPLLSKKQRTALLDLDLWNKDQLDLAHFENWIMAYAQAPQDELRVEFSKSSEFLLYLKGRFNIWTFDAEEPEYPDHDYYFLTDDGLLLFEFDEGYPNIDTIRFLVRELYSDMGVENAYTFLFKLVSDSYSILQEEEFEQKKARLSEFGFVDYYDALELHSPFRNEDHLKAQIILNKKSAMTPDLENDSKIQGLHKASITAFKGGLDVISHELSGVNPGKRSDFLKFNFLRLVNATLALSGSMKEGSVAMTKTGQKTKNYLLLGLDYIKNTTDLKGQALLEVYDFNDLYKVGFNLVRFIQDDVKKALKKFHFEEENENFLGDSYCEFLDHLFDEIPRLPTEVTSGPRKKSKEINDYQSYLEARRVGNQLIEVLPFAEQFYETIHQLVNEGVILDEYYMNYSVSEINLEAILLSTFIHYSLGLIHSGEHKQRHSPLKKNKMGLTIDEFRDFIKKYPMLTDEDTAVENFPEQIKKEIDSFCLGFGLNAVDLRLYICKIMKGHLSGYDFEEMLFEDFKHVGGPILLRALNQ